MNSSKPILPKWPFYLASSSSIFIALLLLFLSGPKLSYPILSTLLIILLFSILTATLPFLLEYRDSKKFHLSKTDEEFLLFKEQLHSLLAELHSTLQSTHQEHKKLEHNIHIFDSLIRRFESRIKNFPQSHDPISHYPQDTSQINDSESFISPPQENIAASEFSCDLSSSEQELFSDATLNTLADNSPPSSCSIQANILMGIGSKLYIRGEGGGLSWTSGKPMEFIELGRWQWTSLPSSESIRFQIYKNDEIPSDQPIQSINPGESLEIKPTFSL